MRRCLQPSPAKRVAALAAVMSAALLALACSPAASPSQTVKVGRNDPPPSCEQISVLSAYASNSDNDDLSVRQKLRERAAASGANYVRIDELNGTNSLKEYKGTAYRCPPEK